MTFYGGPVGSSNVYVPGRDDAVDAIMREWEYKFCIYADVTIFVTTFNVNGKASPGKIPHWLRHSGPAPDFYVVGLQEMDLSTQTFFSDVSSREDDWIGAVDSSLPENVAYDLVDSVRLVGIMLMVYKRSGCPARVPNDSVLKARVATGVQLIARMGNKGGVGISMLINNSRVCFLCAHLAAGTEELEKRNQDYRDISQMRFEPTNVSLFEHDVIFWLGDLNYRLETQHLHTPDNVRRLCATNKSFRDMIAFDTLKQQQKANQVFVDFNEPNFLDFRPSYKYDPGTSEWDSSEKQRAPAWCDRILWRSERPDTVVQSYYDSVDAITLSDHKPVKSHFVVTTQKYDETRIPHVHEEAVREADRRINEALPQVSLSELDIDFGDVYFFESSVRSITVRNTGKTNASFSFVVQPHRSSITDSWLSVTPPSANLKIGASCLLSLQVVVDKKTAWSSEKNGVLSDILIMRLDKGRDHFIPVTAKYHHSVYGASFIQLIQMEHSLDKPTANLIDLGVEEPISDAVSAFVPVPVAMYRMVESLRRAGLQNIRFDDVSSHSEFIALRNVLDTQPNRNLFDVCHSPFNMFNAFLRLVDSFRDEVVPRGMQTECVNAAGDAMRSWSCVQRFPRENRSVFEYFVQFTRELLAKNNDATTQMQVMADILFKTELREDKKDERTQRLRFFETVCAFTKEACTGAFGELIAL